ncbi:MAG: hypothetical protein MUF42_12060 [Cytophagaceae bacterium]|jgi:hypothetical protein|nr:hypothetical protein [Cytophagaceae bacterium]
MIASFVKLYGQLYFPQHNQANVLYQPSFVGSQKAPRIASIFNFQTNQAPIQSPGMRNVFVAYDNVSRSKTKGYGMYVLFDRIQYYQNVSSFFSLKDPPLFKENSFTTAFLYSFKYSLPNLQAKKSNYSFSPGFSIKIDRANGLEHDGFSVNRIPLSITYTKIFFQRYGASLGGSFLINSKNAFLGASVNLRGILQNSETQTFVLETGKNAYDSTQSNFDNGLILEHIYSAGFTFPKKPKRIFSCTLLGHVGFVHAENKNLYSQMQKKYINEGRVFSTSLFNQHGQSVQLKFYILIIGISHQAYLNYSQSFWLGGIQLKKTRVLAAFHAQGFSAGMNTTLH